ncbi:MAG: EAL domain-containing protein [Desulfovibrionales bacterium]|mgnify:FL=1|nr:EAL domain-containing protein [Desulfovibrionales bacterium]
MDHARLSQEEYEFLSSPLENNARWRETLPLRRVHPDLGAFLRDMPVGQCALICTTPEHARATLELLRRGSLDAQIPLLGYVEAMPDPDFAPACAMLPRTGISLFAADAMVPEQLALLAPAQGRPVRYVHSVDSRTLPAESLYRRAVSLSRLEHGAVTVLTLLCGPVPPATLACAFLSYPAVVVDSVLYLMDQPRPEAWTSQAAVPEAWDVVAVFRDQHRLQQKSRLLEGILDCVDLPLVAGYADGELMGGNQAFLRLSGYQRADLHAHFLRDLVSREYEAAQETVFEALLATGRGQDLRTELLSASGARIPCRLQLFVHAEDGRPLFFWALYAPEQMAAEPEQEQLTGREQFLIRLQGALQRSIRQKDYAFAVLVMGIDNHGMVMEQVGTRDRDEFAGLLAKRVDRCLRSLDVRAHLDPHHFFILLDDVTDVIGAVRVAQRIQEETRKPFRLGQREMLITCSIGMVLAPFSYENPEEILRDGETALQRAMQRGERQTVVFDDRQNNRAMQFLRIETELRGALLNNEVCMHYQPVMSLQSGAMLGMEAFMRWERKHRGLVRAERFLPFAEHSDIMFELEGWAIRQTCKTLALMQRLCGPGFFLGLNVSLKNMLRIGFLEELAAVIQAHDIDPGTILLEVREAWLPQFAERFPVVLGQVARHGLGVVLDHFNARRTSLLDLHHLPLRGVKLAPSLIEDTNVVKSLVAIAKAAGMHIHVPGLEQAGQIATFRDLGCDFAQGEALAPSMTAEKIQDFAAERFR